MRKLSLFIIVLLLLPGIAGASLTSFSASPASIFKCQASTIAITLSDTSVTAVTGSATSTEPVHHMIPFQAAALQTQTTTFTLTSNGTHWIGTLGNDENLLWGYRDITFAVIASPNASYTTSQGIFIYSDQCTGTGMTSYQNATASTTLGNNTRRLFASDMDLITWALYPYLMLWGYMFYVIVIGAVTASVYMKTQNSLAVLFSLFVSIAALASSDVIPIEARSPIVALFALIFAAIFYRLFVRD